MATDTTQIDCIVRRVRREVAEHFGFVEPQATHLVACCAEVSVRVDAALREAGLPSLLLRLGLLPVGGHFVLLCGPWLVDGSITQFASPVMCRHAKGPLPNGFCFPAGPLAGIETGPVEVPPWIDGYPIGPIAGVRAEAPKRRAIYAGRGNLVREYPTRFGPGRLGGDVRTSLVAAAHSSDVGWRRAVALTLCDFPDAVSRELARCLSGDADTMVRTAALRAVSRLG